MVLFLLAQIPRLQPGPKILVCLRKLILIPVSIQLQIGSHRAAIKTMRTPHSYGLCMNLMHTPLIEHLDRMERAYLLSIIVDTHLIEF